MPAMTVAAKPSCLQPTDSCLFALVVVLVAVVLQDRPRGHFFGALPVAVILLRLVDDVLVHPLFLLADALQMLALWHRGASLPGQSSPLLRNSASSTPAGP